MWGWIPPALRVLCICSRTFLQSWGKRFPPPNATPAWQKQDPGLHFSESGWEFQDQIRFADSAQPTLRCSLTPNGNFFQSLAHIQLISKPTFLKYWCLSKEGEKVHNPFLSRICFRVIYKSCNCNRNAAKKTFNTFLQINSHLPTIFTYIFFSWMESLKQSKLLEPLYQFYSLEEQGKFNPLRTLKEAVLNSNVAFHFSNFSFPQDKLGHCKTFGWILITEGKFSISQDRKWNKKAWKLL